MNFTDILKHRGLWYLLIIVFAFASLQYLMAANKKPQITIETQSGTLSIEYQKVDPVKKAFVSISTTTLNPGGDPFKIYSLDYYEIDPTTSPWSMKGGEQYFITASGPATVTISNIEARGVITVRVEQGKTFISDNYIGNSNGQVFQVDSFSMLTIWSQIPS